MLKKNIRHFLFWLSNIFDRRHSLFKLALNFTLIWVNQSQVGYYGLPSVVNFDMKSAIRRIEDWLLPRKGSFRDGNRLRRYSLGKSIPWFNDILMYEWRYVLIWFLCPAWHGLCMIVHLSASLVSLYEVMESLISTILNNTVLVINLTMSQNGCLETLNFVCRAYAKIFGLCHWMDRLEGKEIGEIQCYFLSKIDTVVCSHGMFAEFVPWDIWDWSRFGASGVNQIKPSSIEWAMLGICGTSWGPRVQLIDTGVLCDIFQGFLLTLPHLINK